MSKFKELNTTYKSISFYEEEYNCQNQKFKVG